MTTGRLALAVPLAVLLSAAPAHAAPQDFSSWMAQLRAEARQQGVSASIVQDALTQTVPLARVIELDRKQPEHKITFSDYRKKILTKARIKQGRDLLAANRVLLNEIHRTYGVAPHYVIALWSMESNFGRNMGGFDVMDALVTLAYDGRRAGFFRKETLNALTILDQDHIRRADFRGSWAGAMGQCQFMPSTFLKYAVDYDGDGRRDIWGTPKDVFASIANYLRAEGWQDGTSWGRAVKLTKKIPANFTGLDQKHPLSQWSAMGIRRADGKALPKVDLMASLVQPDGPTGSSYLVYDNYRAVMRWNRSTYFATTIGLLADHFAK